MGIRDSFLDAENLIEKEDLYNAHNYKPLDVVLTKGQGVWVWDVDGNRYLDCLSAYSALNQGHAHPKILKAMVEQAAKLPLTSRAFRNDQLPRLAEELCKATGYEMMLPMNSGTEAVETALKVARKWGYVVKRIPEDQAEIITCSGNFHGRTITVISFSTEEQYRDGFAPFTPGFRTIPYGDIEALNEVITSKTAGFLVEPIQGENGVILPPEGYLEQVREVCTRRNILFIADEIQTGLGRTGKLLACDWEGVKPDIVTVGKALSGGYYPVSAVLASKEILGLFEPGDHGSTFGGNPLACAIAREALAVILEENLAERASELGTYFLDRLSKISCEEIKEVRGRGLLIGIELEIKTGYARQYCEKLREEGILCKETHGTIIRFAPPLMISKDELDWAIERIENVFQ